MSKHSLIKVICTKDISPENNDGPQSSQASNINIYK